MQCDKVQILLPKSVTETDLITYHGADAEITRGPLFVRKRALKALFVHVVLNEAFS